MKLPIDGLKIGLQSEVISNPYSGESITLTPEAVAVYDAIKGAELFGMYDIVQKGCDWFKQYYAKEYMVLLD